jgi:hypothetical protein
MVLIVQAPRQSSHAKPDVASPAYALLMATLAQNNLDRVRGFMTAQGFCRRPQWQNGR